MLSGSTAISTALAHLDHPNDDLAAKCGIKSIPTPMDQIVSSLPARANRHLKLNSDKIGVAASRLALLCQRVKWQRCHWKHFKAGLVMRCTKPEARMGGAV